MSAEIQEKINNKIVIHKFGNEEVFFAKLVQYFLEQIKHGVKNFILPGGQTPIMFYKKLSKERIDWSQIKIALSDERLIDYEKDDLKNTNYYIINKYLLSKISASIKPKFINLPLNNDKVDINTAFDFVKHFSTFLGIGKDGHIASIFKNEEQISNNPYFIFTAKEHNNFYRVSWRKEIFLNSKSIFFILKGNEKENIVRNIYNYNKIEDLPYIELIKKFSGNIRVMWLKEN
tara:strand:- start:938 stop:1633 length:696 start_codon:yes stop_codon:yes gene_type:complete